MHLVCMLLDIMSIILVEFGAIPRPGCSPPDLPMVGRLERRAQGGTETTDEQLDEFVSVSYDHELRKGLSEGAQSR